MVNSWFNPDFEVNRLLLRVIMLDLQEDGDASPSCYEARSPTNQIAHPGKKIKI